METVKVDLDEGRIFVEGEWLSEEELKYAIKTKISSDDFDVEHLAISMKALQKVMGESSMMEFRLSNGMIHALKNMSDDTGETTGSIIRKALESYMGGAPAPPVERKRAPEPEPEPEPEPKPEPEPESFNDDEEEDDMDIDHIARRRRRRN